MAAVIPDPASAEVAEAWQNIAELRLRPGRSVHFYQHHYRGTPWLIIADQENETYFRCSSEAEHFLSLLDGSRSVEQALHQARASQSPSLQQQDVILLMGNLKSAGLLEGDAEAPLKPQANPLANPFAVKFALFDPDRMLQKTAHWFRPLFSLPVLFLWIGMVITALATALLNWQALAEHSAARFSDPQNLLWYWLLYPLVKGLHELGHAYATRVWGGAVHEMGITLLVLFPVPYVDSSASHRFASKQRRMTVCAAGIMVEVLLASIALLVWANTDPGMVRDLAFDIVVIGGASTLLFNANPLLRFDGYYLFSELIEIPNLGTRADQYLGYLGKRYLLDVPGLRSPVTAAGEAKWLIVYGICARIYRVFISLFIALWVAGKFLIIGTLLALWAIVGQIIYPLARGIYRLVPVVLAAGRIRRFAVIVAIFSLVLLSSLLMPVDHSTYTEGVISLPESAFIRAGADGIVTAVELADGDPVDSNSLILKLENMELQARLDGLVARLEETRARQQQVFLQDRTQADILGAKVFAIAADIQDVKEQMASLDVVSATAGVVSLPMASDLPGRYVNRGDVIGYVAGPGLASALVVVPQLDIDAVRRNMNSIEVRLNSRPAETLAAQFVRELPQGTDRLPHRILGSGSGGQTAVDVRDETGTQLLSNVFLVEVALPLEQPGNYLGQRIYVRFVHQGETLGNRLARRLNQFLLQPPFV